MQTMRPEAEAPEAGLASCCRSHPGHAQSLRCVASHRPSASWQIQDTLVCLPLNMSGMITVAMLCIAAYVGVTKALVMA